MLLADEAPEACAQCRQRERIVGRLTPVAGKCAACLSDAPGFCRTCDRELFHGSMPRVTNPVTWKRIKAESE